MKKRTICSHMVHLCPSEELAKSPARKGSLAIAGYFWQTQINRYAMYLYGDGTILILNCAEYPRMIKTPKWQGVITLLQQKGREIGLDRFEIVRSRPPPVF